MATQMLFEPLFALGLIVKTPGVKSLVRHGYIHVDHFLHRHQRGDWGDVNGAIRRENGFALKHGHWLYSSYRIANGMTLDIYTEYDRSQTTLLLPYE